MLAILCCHATVQAAALPALPAVRHSAILPIAALPDGYALLGLQLGMSPDEVIVVAKSSGWKYAVRQAALPSKSSYVDQIRIQAPFPTTVEFSAVTGDAMRVIVLGTSIEIVLEQDALLQAAIAKWGEPTVLNPANFLRSPRGWKEKNGVRPVYVRSDWDQQAPSSVQLADEPAMAASARLLAGPAAPKPSL